MLDGYQVTRRTEQALTLEGNGSLITFVMLSPAAHADDHDAAFRHIARDRWNATLDAAQVLHERDNAHYLTLVIVMRGARDENGRPLDGTVIEAFNDDEHTATYVMEVGPAGDNSALAALDQMAFAGYGGQGPALVPNTHVQQGQGS